MGRKLPERCKNGKGWERDQRGGKDRNQNVFHTCLKLSKNKKVSKRKQHIVSLNISLPSKRYKEQDNRY